MPWNKVKLLNALIDAYPGSVLLQDKFGRTPLYLAVEYKIGESISILEQLLCAPNGTDALTIPCFGQDAFKGVDCRDVNPLSRPSRFHRKIQCMDACHRTPLYMVWDAALHSMSSERWNKLGMNRSNVKPTGKRMQKAFLFLEYAYLNDVGGDIPKNTRPRQRRKMHQHVDDDCWNQIRGDQRDCKPQKSNTFSTQFRITHAVATFYKYLPQKSLDLALNFYSRQLETREEVSRYIPLHSAILHDAGSQAIRSLVKANVNTLSMETREGRLPLHLLLDSPSPDHKLLRDVIEKYPAAGGIKDPKNCLFPAMIAAASTTNIGSEESQESREESSRDHLSAIYMLISARPDILVGR